MTLAWSSPTGIFRLGGNRFRFVEALLGARNPLRARLLAWLAAATFSTMAAVGLIGMMAEQGFDGGVDFRKLGLFVLIAALVVYSQYNALTLTSEVCDDAVDRIRHDMLGVFRQANLRSVEAVGTARIYGIVSRATAIFNEAGPAVIHGIIALGVVILIAVHLAVVSPGTFVVMLFFGGMTLWLYRHFATLALGDKAAAEDSERRYQDLFLQFLEGFRQVKLDRRMADDLEFGYISAAVADWRVRKRRLTQRLNEASAVAFAGCYLILAAVVFALPQYIGGGVIALKITYITIFLLATFNILMRAVPTLERANAAFSELSGLGPSLGAGNVPPRAPASAAEPAADLRFKEISLQRIVAKGRASGRAIGPVSLTIRPGEIIGIQGLNGAGKTTLLRILTGLDGPDEGRILWDGKPVDATRAESYRSLFAAAFDDEQLVDRLYGCTGVPMEVVRATMERVGLDPARVMDGDRITKDAVSHAFRQRMLLALSLLRRRPILVLDDIVRDQDHRLRSALPTLLGELAAAGTCIIVTETNDLWMRPLADHLLVLRDGAITAQQ